MPNPRITTSEACPTEQCTASDDDTVYKERSVMNYKYGTRKDHFIDNSIYLQIVARGEAHRDKPMMNQLDIRRRLAPFVNLRDPAIYTTPVIFTAESRAIVIDWTMNVCAFLRFRRNTFHIALDHIDRYMTCIRTTTAETIQVIALTCVQIGAKIVEMDPPTMRDLCNVTGNECNVSDMLHMQRMIYRRLNFDFKPISLSTWIHRYMEKWFNTAPQHNEKAIFVELWEYVFDKICHIIDLCCLDEGILRFPYSIVIAGCLHYVLSPAKAVELSGFTHAEIRECVRWLAPYVSMVHLDSTLYRYAFDATRRYCFNLRKPLVIDPRDQGKPAYTLQTHHVNVDMLTTVITYREIIQNMYSSQRQATNSVPATAASTSSNNLNQPSTSGQSRN